MFGLNCHNSNQSSYGIAVNPVKAQAGVPHIRAVARARLFLFSCLLALSSVQAHHTGDVAAPEDLEVTVGGGTMTLTWAPPSTAPGVTAYRVYVDGVMVAQTEQTAFEGQAPVLPAVVGLTAVGAEGEGPPALAIVAQGTGGRVLVDGSFLSDADSLLHTALKQIAGAMPFRGSTSGGDYPYCSPFASFYPPEPDVDCVYPPPGG